jgi:hypothetical protein
MESQLIIFEADDPVEYSAGKVTLRVSDRGNLGVLLEIFGEQQNIDSIKERLPDDIPIYAIDRLKTVVVGEGTISLVEERDLLDDAMGAINRGSLEDVIDIIENQGLDPETKDADGINMLMRAAAYGRYDICEYLVLEKKVDVNACNNNGFNALLFASARYGEDTADSLIEKFKITRLLVENGVMLDQRIAKDAIKIATRSGLNETVSLIKRSMPEIDMSGEKAFVMPAWEFNKRIRRITESVFIVLVPEPGENIIEQGEAVPEELYKSNMPNHRDRDTSKLFRVTKPLPILTNGDGPRVEVHAKLISPYLSNDESVQMLYVDKEDVPEKLAQLFPDGQWRWVCPTDSAKEGSAPLGRIRLAGEWLIVFDQEIEGGKRLKSMELHCSLSDEGEITQVWGSKEISGEEHDNRIIRALVGMRLEGKKKGD